MWGRFMATALEIAREIFPEYSDDECGFVLWEHTGFPALWALQEGETIEDCLRRQLTEYRDKEACSLGLTLLGPAESCGRCRIEAIEHAEWRREMERTGKYTEKLQEWGRRTKKIRITENHPVLRKRSTT